MSTISSKPPIKRNRSIDKIKREIRGCLNAKIFKKANTLINNEIAKHPKDVDFIKFKALYYFKTENYQDAFKYYEMALTCGFKNAGLLDTEFIDFLKCHEILHIPYGQVVLEHLVLNPHFLKKLDSTPAQKKSKKSNNLKDIKANDTYDMSIYPKKTTKS